MAAGLFAPWRAWGGAFNTGRRGVSLAELSFADLSARLDAEFHVQAAPGRVVVLKLIEAELDPVRPQLGRQSPPDADHEKFTLLFSGPGGEPLPQETYQFEHGQLGRFALFIVPVFTRNPQMTKYAAVFNRPRQNQIIG